MFGCALAFTAAGAFLQLRGVEATLQLRCRRLTARSCSRSRAQALGCPGLSTLACGLTSCDSQAPGSLVVAHRLSYSAVWDLPESGIEPLSPALAGRFFSTEPSGKPQRKIFKGEKLTRNKKMMYNDKIFNFPISITILSFYKKPVLQLEK